MQNAKRRSPYCKHMFTNVDGIIKDLEKMKSNDSKRMYNVLYPFLEKLKDNGIYELKNISKVFSDCGFNSKSTIKIITFLLDKLKDIKIVNRESSKLNEAYRNVIFNSLFFDYPEKIIQLVDFFVTQHCPNIHNHDFLIFKLNQFIPDNIVIFSNANNETENNINEIISNFKNDENENKENGPINDLNENTTGEDKQLFDLSNIADEPSKENELNYDLNINEIISNLKNDEKENNENGLINDLNGNTTSEDKQLFDLSNIADELYKENETDYDLNDSDLDIETYFNLYTNYYI